MNFLCLARKNNERILKNGLVGFTILLVLHLFKKKKNNNIFGQMGFKG